MVLCGSATSGSSGCFSCFDPTKGFCLAGGVFLAIIASVGIVLACVYSSPIGGNDSGILLT